VHTAVFITVDMDADIFAFELDDNDNPFTSTDQTLPNQQSTPKLSPSFFSSTHYHEDAQFDFDATFTFDDLDLLPDLDIPHLAEADLSEWPDLTGDVSHWYSEPQGFDLLAEKEVSSHDLPPTETCPADVVSTESANSILSLPELDGFIQPKASIPANLETPDSTPESETQAGPVKQSKRTHIPPATKAMFEEELQINPYPDFGRISLLSYQTGLPFGTVKTWFSNNRHRKPIINGRFMVFCLQ
jgi:hypothetical protein